MQEPGAGWKIAGLAVFVWPVVWFLPASCCCSAPLVPMAQEAGFLAEILRVFVAPLSFAAGLAVGESVLVVLQFWDQVAPPERRIGSTWRLLVASAVGIVPYFAVFGGVGLLTGVAAGMPFQTLAAYLVVAVVDLAALALPFAFYGLARRVRAEGA